MGKRGGENLKSPTITLPQARLARITAELGGVPGMSKKKLREMAGVKTTSVEKSPGFKAALAQYGLTEELIATALAEDIVNKPRNRYHELSLAADILGMKKQGQNVDNSKHLTLVISGESAERYGAIAGPQVKIHDASEPQPEQI